MTCNLQWSEIPNALQPGQRVVDRPDRAAHVFTLKLHALMACVIDKNVFGEVRAHDSVIAFQKRGLPHAHCILFLTPSSTAALLPPDFVDIVIYGNAEH